MGGDREADEEILRLCFIVPPDREGWRLDRFLHDRIPRLSRTKLRKIITEEVTKVGGGRFKPSHRVRQGEEIIMFRPAPVEPDAPKTFDVVYEDEALFVVDKPPGLPVHPTARFHRHTLTWLLRERFGDRDRPIITHRLDRETSGVLVCAKTKAAERHLKLQFEARTVTKRYLAIVRGDPEFEREVVDLPLGPAQGSDVRIKMGPRTDALGQPATTEFRVLERLEGASLLLASPKTGRQHQIRAHLAAIGLPVVGDKIYGLDERLFIEYVEGGLSEEAWARLELPRQALHAHQIELEHPLSHEPLSIEAPLAADLEEYLAGKRG